jgi:hypothetical protein
MRIILICALSLLLAPPVFSQSSDRWRGLVLDEATPEQAIEVLGKAKSDKSSGRGLSFLTRGIDKAKELRLLHWEKVEGFEDVKLYFVDGTLAIIQLEKPKDKIPAKVLAEAYPDAEFKIGRGANSSAFYEMEAVTPNSIITAGVGNVTGSVSRGLFGDLGRSGRIDQLEGNVIMIFIKSRRVDDKRGVDALK